MDIRKIVLAVDPFADEPELNLERIIHSVSPFTQNAEVMVDAVYVLTPNSLSLTPKSFPDHLEYYRLLAGEQIKGALSELGANVSAKTTVLPHGTNSTRESVEHFLKYATEQKADLIALSTHARKGVDRFFLGSFAESLIIRSKIPMLITNPNCPWDATFNRILFATDFEDGSPLAFESALSIAKKLSAHLTLFHRLAPENPYLPPPGTLIVEEWARRKRETQAEASRLKEYAERQGVSIEIQIDTKNHRVAPAILDAAIKNQTNLIIIGAHSATDLSAMGSTPRQVLRASTCPVLVLPIG